MRDARAVEHYSLDHLGTPRLVTDGAGHKIGYHVYWPFGEEWSPASAQENSPLKFTGHERDADRTGGSAPLDYMHARYYGAGWGRFLSADPDQWYTKQNGTDEEKREFEINLRRPQGWNRYSYAYNNPTRYTDPDGKVVLVDDPNFNHHKKEIKAMLDRAVDLAKRLPKRAGEEV